MRKKSHFVTASLYYQIKCIIYNDTYLFLHFKDVHDSFYITQTAIH